MIALKLIAHLKQQSAVAAKVSHRIYKHKPQSAALPNVLVDTMSGRPDYGLAGPIADLAKRVDVAVDAESYEESVTISELIRAAIESKAQLTTWDGTNVKGCSVLNETDTEFPKQDGDGDAVIYRRTTTYNVHYQR